MMSTYRNRRGHGRNPMRGVKPARMVTPEQSEAPGWPCKFVTCAGNEHLRPSCHCAKRAQPWTPSECITPL